MHCSSKLDFAHKIKQEIWTHFSPKVKHFCPGRPGWVSRELTADCPIIAVLCWMRQWTISPCTASPRHSRSGCLCPLPHLLSCRIMPDLHITVISVLQQLHKEVRNFPLALLQSPSKPPEISLTRPASPHIRMSACAMVCHTTLERRPVPLGDSWKLTSCKAQEFISTAQVKINHRSSCTDVNPAQLSI